MRDVKRSISSHNHGCDRSSSLMLDLCFFDFDFQCPPPLSSLSKNISVLREHVLSCLLNTHPSLLPLPSGLCLGDSDLLRLILGKTLACSRLPDTLRERPDLHPLRCSPLTFGVLDSECCDISWTFEFLPEHPSKRGWGEIELCCSLMSPLEHPKEKYNLDTATKLARAKPNKRSGDADLSKDKLGPESPLEFKRSWYVEGHIRSGVISSVLMQRCQRTIKQRYSPCEGPLSLDGYVADKLYQERAPRLWSGDKERRNRNPLGATKPVLQTQKTPSLSLAFIKENIDVLRTMIKEHDQQAKMKAIPRKLAYADSDKESSAGSLAKGFSDRFSLESLGTSDIRRQTRSTVKSQKTPSKNKESTHLRRSRRLEDRGTTREKAIRERSKSRRNRFGHQETSSYSRYEEGSDDACEDLNSPYKRPKPTPFTQRITHFKYHKRAKLPRNIRVYEGNKDSEHHLGIFSAAAEQEEWLMPIWCKMFRQTLGGVE
ncbi:hypothetical protein Tco_0597530 [Tanacetum coccineum]